MLASLIYKEDFLRHHIREWEYLRFVRKINNMIVPVSGLSALQLNYRKNHLMKE